MRRTLTALTAVVALALTTSGCTPAGIGTAKRITSDWTYPVAVSTDGTWALVEETTYAFNYEVIKRLALKNTVTNATTRMMSWTPFHVETFMSADASTVTWATDGDQDSGYDRDDTNTIYRWTRATGAVTVLDQRPSSRNWDHLGAVSRNGRYVGLTDGAYRLVILDTVTGTRTVVHNAPTSRQMACGISDDGKTLLYHRDNVLRVRDLAGAKTLASWTMGPYWDDCGELSDNGMVAYFAGRSSSLPGALPDPGDNHIYAWSRRTGKVSLAVARPTVFYDYATTADGRHLFFVDDSGDVERPAWRFDRVEGTTVPLTDTDRAGSMVVAGAAGNVALFAFSSAGASDVYLWRA